MAGQPVEQNQRIANETLITSLKSRKCSAKYFFDLPDGSCPEEGARLVLEKVLPYFTLKYGNSLLQSTAILLSELRSLFFQNYGR